MKLIPLDAVLAEIEKRIKTCLNQREEMIIADCETLAGDATARAGELQCLRDSIESFEVTEVDLEKEIGCSLPKPAWGWNEDYFGKSDPAYSMEQMKEFAKHFFELGLKAQKGE